MCFGCVAGTLKNTLWARGRFWVSIDTLEMVIFKRSGSIRNYYGVDFLFLSQILFSFVINICMILESNAKKRSGYDPMQTCKSFVLYNLRMWLWYLMQIYFLKKYTHIPWGERARKTEFRSSLKLSIDGGMWWVPPPI